MPIVGVTRYLSHDREQLRLEAVRLLLDEPSMRDGALRRALDDAHPRVVREALEAMIAMGNAASATKPSAVPADLFARLVALIESREQIVSTWQTRLEYGYPTPALRRDEALSQLLPAFDALGVSSRLQCRTEPLRLDQIGSFPSPRATRRALSASARRCDAAWRSAARAIRSGADAGRSIARGDTADRG